MIWELFGVALAAFALAWFACGPSIRAVFAERGISGGLAVWSGMALMSVPFVVFVVYVLPRFLAKSGAL